MIFKFAYYGQKLSNTVAFPLTESACNLYSHQELSTVNLKKKRAELMTASQIIILNKVYISAS